MARPSRCQRDSQERVGFLRGRARRSTFKMTRYIDAHKEQFGVEPIRRILEFAPATSGVEEMACSEGRTVNWGGPSRGAIADKE